MKGWKKTKENRGTEKKSLKEFTTMRRGRSENNCQSRKRKSKGWKKKKNGKITKKGRKNRSQAGLISYMSGEKKRSQLRKLKRGFDRKKKQEVSRVVNQQFNTVPGKGFANLSGMLKRDPENERARYKDPGRRARDDSKMFENIEEASGFLDKAVVREREQERGLIAGREDRPPRASTTTDRQRTGSRSSGSGQSSVPESQLERARA